MKRHLRLGTYVGLGVVLVVGLSLLTTWRHNRPLPEPPKRERVAPPLAGLPKMEACWVEFAQRSTWGGLATAGFTQTSPWNVTTSGLVVRHPEGTVVIDVGFSSRYDQEMLEYPWVARKRLKLRQTLQTESTPDLLRKAGVNPEQILWVIPTHMHIDHVGGLVDLPKAPVLLPQEEIDFVHKDLATGGLRVVPAHARAVAGRMTPLHFEAKPYETFEERADVFGDGSVVVVRLPGHTPGSVGVFVNLPNGRRLFSVGDTVNLMEAIERRLPKSFAMASTDAEPEQAKATVSKLWALHQAVPSVEILPAHDRDAWLRTFAGAPRCLP